jgi:hypothetical protein
MKTYNNHPQWYNKPIRLSEEQTNNPTPVFDEFFQCYHLNEVRQTMWRWLVTVVSSAGSVSNDPHERNNDLYFYEQIEMLVEGVWVIHREGKAVVPVCSEPCIEERAISNTRFSKPPRLIEKVHSQPEEVIREVFSEVILGDLLEDLLPAWLRVAMVNSDSLYSDGDSREILHEFYDQLLLFLEALYVIYEAPEEHKAYCLSAELLADPRQVVAAFFQQFSIEYIRRELHDFLDAGIGYAGVYPDGFTPWQAWMVYGQVECLVEGAWRVYEAEQEQFGAAVLL